MSTPGTEPRWSAVLMPGRFSITSAPTTDTDAGASCARSARRDALTTTASSWFGVVASARSSVVVPLAATSTGSRRGL